MYYGKRVASGMSVQKLTDLFLKAMIVCVLVGLGIGVLISAMFCLNMKNRYESQIAALEATITENQENHAKEVEKQVSVVTTELNAVIERRDASIETLTAERDSLATEIDTLTTALTEQYTEEEDDFQLLKRYSYVFDIASEDSGITVGLIRYVEEQSQRFNVNPHLMWGIYDLESSFNTRAQNATSSARGLGQTLESTARLYYENVLGYGKGSYTHSMAYDPYVNVEITCCMIGRNLESGLRNCLDLYGDKTPTYPDRVLKKAANHGITITDSNRFYPY